MTTHEEHVLVLLERINHKQRETQEAIVATQTEVAQLVQSVEQIKADLETAKGNIEAGFAELETQLSEGKTGNEVNLDPLKQAVGSLEPAAEGLENLKANPPASAEAPAPAAPAQDASPPGMVGGTETPHASAGPA